MNWYKVSQSEVQIASWCDEGVVVYIDNKRYWCAGKDTRLMRKLNSLINAKAWGKAKNLIRNWPCVREEINQEPEPQGNIW